MTSPRIIDFSDPILEEFSRKPEHYTPEEDPITEQLWRNSENIANLCLSTDYIQGVKEGSLSPNGYGQYSMQDCAYCSNTTGNYQIMISLSLAAKQQGIAKFAMARYFDYQKYTSEILDTWNIKDTSALTLSKEVKEYIESERSLLSRVGGAENLSPIYFIVAMIPCSRLWPWLAAKMTPTASNVYNFWIVANKNDDSFKKLEDFVNKFFQDNPLTYDSEKAKSIYQGSMTLELNFFKSIELLRINKLDPASGPIGTDVKITGTFPRAVNAVIFKDKIVPVDPPVTENIKVEAPPGPQNAVDVFVIDVAGNGSNTLKYIYNT